MILVAWMEDRSSPSSGIEAFQDLERWLSGQAEASAGLSERESECRGREILRLALHAHIDARGDGDVGEAIVLGGDHGPGPAGLQTRSRSPAGGPCSARSRSHGWAT